MLVTILMCALLGGLFSALASLVGKLAHRRLDEDRAKKFSGISLGLAGGLAVGLGPVVAQSRFGDELEIALGLKHRSEIEMKRAFEPLLKDPTFRRELDGKTPADARAYMAGLAHDGLALLDADHLARWAALRARLADVSPNLCASMWKGGISSTLVFRALDSLSEVERQEWGDLSANASLLALRNPAAKPALDMTVREGIAEIAAMLPPVDRNAFETDVANPALTDQRACELSKAVFWGATRLDSARRASFYRALAAAP